MTKRMLSNVRVALNWLFWGIAKFLFIEGSFVTGMAFEVVSRMLGSYHLSHG